MTSCSPRRATISPLKKSEEGKSSMFSVAARWLKEKRQSLSFSSVQLPRPQMAEWDIFFLLLKRQRVVEKMPGWKGLRLFFRWLSNDWMWLTQIISLIAAQQAPIGPSPPLPAALHALNQLLLRTVEVQTEWDSSCRRRNWFMLSWLWQNVALIVWELFDFSFLFERKYFCCINTERKQYFKSMDSFLARI